MENNKTLKHKNTLALNRSRKILLLLCDYELRGSVDHQQTLIQINKCIDYLIFIQDNCGPNYLLKFSKTSRRLVMSYLATDKRVSLLQDET